MKIKGKTFLLTGGGSGIGRELCLRLVQRGAYVIILDISDDSMQETKRLAGDKENQIGTFRVNLENKDEIFAFHDQLMKSGHVIDGLINNAGIIQPFVSVNDLQIEAAERVVKINFLGMYYLTKALLPHLLSRPEAHIVNISSMGGFIPFPGQTIYSASKAAVKIFTEGLFAELLDTNVRVTLIMPGAVRTNIAGNSGVSVHMADDRASAYQAMPAEKAAEIILQGIEKNKPRVLVGSDARFLDLFYRINPVKAVRYIVSKMKNL